MKKTLILSLILCMIDISIGFGQCQEEIESYRYRSAIDCLINAESGSVGEEASRIQLQLGKLYLDQFQPNEAINWYKKEGDNPDYLVGLGNTYFVMGNYSQAESYYKKTIKIDRVGVSQAVAHLGLANIAQKRIDQLYDQMTIWAWKEPEGVESENEKASDHFDRFLNSLIAALNEDPAVTLDLPAILDIDFKYVPSEKIGELKALVAECQKQATNEHLKVYLTVLDAQLVGEEYIKTIQETDDFWSPNNSLYWNDTDDFNTRLKYRFGNSNLKRQAERKFSEAEKMMKSSSLDSISLSLSLFKLADYERKVAAEFSDIIYQMNDKTAESISYRQQSEGDLQENFVSALDVYHQALRLTGINFHAMDLGENPDLSAISRNNIEDHIRSLVVFEYALRQKSETLTKAREYSTPNPDNYVGFHLIAFRVTFESIMIMDRFIDLVSLTIENDSDKFFYASKIKDDRLFAIDYCMTRFQSQPTDKMLNSKVFNFMVTTQFDEDIQAAVDDEKADSFTKPGDLIKIRANGFEIQTTEDSTYLHLAYYFAEKTKAYSLLSAVSQNEEGDDFGVQSVRLGGIRKIQSQLDDVTAVIEFIFTENYLYRFTITSDGLSVTRLRRKGEENVAQDVKAIRNGILFFQDDAYAEQAFSLQKKLLPQFDKEIDNLIIVPDGLMYLVPFEVLLSKKVSKKKRSNYSELPYLIKDYNISYAFSGALFSFNESQSVSAGQSGWIGFAPIFSDNVSVSDGNLSEFDAMLDGKRAILKNGNYVSPLPGTQTEISQIADLFKTRNIDAKVLMSERATETAIKGTDLSSYRYLHIATHGFVNTENPEKSGLMFYPALNDPEDGILYGSEIYDLNIDADLVVLSACETGLGKVVSGEGLIGLTRALQFAGARNQLVSMWKVSDSSTSQLMRDFYSFLSDNPTASYTEALATVKRKMTTSSQYAHPYFWSPFMLIGR